MNPFPKKTRVGGAGFNCVVTSDGGIRALVLDAQPLQIEIGPDHISGGFFACFRKRPSISNSNSTRSPPSYFPRTKLLGLYRCLR